MRRAHFKCFSDAWSDISLLELECGYNSKNQVYCEVTEEKCRETLGRVAP
jgi:hypothetical protein